MQVCEVFVMARVRRKQSVDHDHVIFLGCGASLDPWSDLSAETREDFRILAAAIRRQEQLRAARVKRARPACAHLYLVKRKSG